MANKTKKLVVSDIRNKLFVIPFYQRGYRWTGKNVKQLLSDLLKFTHSEECEYCLQPIVLQDIKKDGYSSILKNEDAVIRVVDGQQRLTTIAIILHKLGVDTTWDIYYDTEKKRLSDILNDQQNLSSINDYFRKDVGDAIDDWLSTLGSDKENVIESLKGLFLANNKRVAFLEYDIDTLSGQNTETEGHEAFLRLNDGKTPLTSSELIRALYMVRSSGLSIQQQMEISKEWEIIENSLQNEQFWQMFNARGLEDTPTRIDLLFALVLRVSLRETKANPRIVFDKLEDASAHYDLEKVWDRVLHAFWWMQSCYSDIELCNYLSWIKNFTDISATTLYDKWRKYPSHKEFKSCVKKIIQGTTFGGKRRYSLDEVDYTTWDKGELRKLFVLLNMLDCNKCKEHFRFDLYGQCRGWDIEHIDSQTPNDFKQDKNKREWLLAAWKELTKDQRLAFLKEFFQESNESLDSFDIKAVNLDYFESYVDFIVESSPRGARVLEPYP